MMSNLVGACPCAIPLCIELQMTVLDCVFPRINKSVQYTAHKGQEINCVELNRH